MTTHDSSESQEENSTTYADELTQLTQLNEMISQDYKRQFSYNTLDLGAYIIENSEYSKSKPYRKIIKGFIKND